MNFTSSIAKTLVGSVIAIVRVAPERLSGTIWYLRAVSPGTSLITAGSISNWPSEIDGTPYCFESRAVISSSWMYPSLTRLAPSLPPFCRWYVRASWSCSAVMRFALRSSSPILTGIVVSETHARTHAPRLSVLVAAGQVRLNVDALLDRRRHPARHHRAGLTHGAAAHATAHAEALPQPPCLHSTSQVPPIATERRPPRQVRIG